MNERQRRYSVDSENSTTPLSERTHFPLFQETSYFEIVLKEHAPKRMIMLPVYNAIDCAHVEPLSFSKFNIAILIG